MVRSCDRPDLMWPLGKIRGIQTVNPLEDTRFCKFHLHVKAALALRALRNCDIWGSCRGSLMTSLVRELTWPKNVVGVTRFDLNQRSGMPSFSFLSLVSSELSGTESSVGRRYFALPSALPPPYTVRVEQNAHNSVNRKKSQTILTGYWEQTLGY